MMGASGSISDGRAHLHRPRPGEQRLDGVLARAHAAARHDGSVGQRARHLEDGAEHHRLDRRAREPAGDAAELRSQALGVDREGPRRAAQREPVRARADHGVRQLDDVGQRPAAASRRPAASTSARRRRRSPRRGRRARRWRRGCSSSSGAERYVSIAATSGRPCRRLVRRTYSSSVPPAIETITCAPPRASRGSSSSRNDLDARVLQPRRPHDAGRALGDARRGRPLLGLQRDRAADHARRPCAGRRGRRSHGRFPAQPAATITGVDSTRPAPRSTATCALPRPRSHLREVPRAASAASAAPRRATGPTGRAPG